MQKLEFLRQPLLGELAGEKKMPFIVATYVYASSQGQRTHSARTKMPFIVATYVYDNLRCYKKSLLFSNLPKGRTLCPSLI